MERKRTELELVVLRATLAEMDSLRGGMLVDAMAEQDTSGRITRQICAKVAPELIDKVDSVLAVLHVSKRRFIEAAIVDAVIRAEAIMQAEGLYDVLNEYHGFQKEEAA